MPTLTQTQRIERIEEIQRLRSDGLKDREIAERLNISRERIAQLAGRRHDDPHAIPAAIRQQFTKHKGGRTSVINLRCTPVVKKKLEDLSKHAKGIGSPAHTQADLIEQYVLTTWQQTFGDG